MKVIFGCHGRLPGRTDCRYHCRVHNGIDVLCLLSETESSRFGWERKYCIDRVGSGWGENNTGREKNFKCITDFGG